MDVVDYLTNHAVVLNPTFLLTVFWLVRIEQLLKAIQINASRQEGTLGLLVEELGEKRLCPIPVAKSP